MERMHGVVCHMIHDVESLAESQMTQEVGVEPNPSHENHRPLSVLQGSALPETPSVYSVGPLEVSGSHTFA